jgi:hypothetical protein
VLDIKSIIYGKEYLLEVYSPQIDTKLRYIGIVENMSNPFNRLKIKDKIIDQLKRAYHASKLPIILAVNRSSAPDIDTMEVHSTRTVYANVTLRRN